ncbi:hypothetical protein CPB83DRAFT_889732 [Crepidotus variabilis]|uniref:MYND-type domain-containing protein n=1 Tax=Crepidotus variabilis TaxID=179855 RepID=A0A9P6ERJ7_9AGAR|nr:hypothetical protein CPB83DRAFT_889732 [Crepidotus variabilis]
MNQETAHPGKRPPPASCTQCKAVKALPFSCGHCWSARYCSKTCKNQHLANGHRKKCKKALQQRQAGDGQDGPTQTAGHGSNGPTVKLTGDGREGPLPATWDGLNVAPATKSDGIGSKPASAAPPTKKKKKAKPPKKAPQTTIAPSNSSYTIGSSSQHASQGFYQSDSDDFDYGEFSHRIYFDDDYENHPYLGWRSKAEIEWWENYSD